MSKPPASSSAFLSFRLSSEGLARVALFFFLVLVLPLFVCMPVWCDISFYDVCARSVLRGEKVYQEVFHYAPPGMFLVQTGLRGLLGWRSEPLRVVDFLVVSAILWLLLAKILPSRLSRASRWWLALLFYFFYFSTSEWCHCQPDTWILLFALGALCLRQRQVNDQLAGQASSARPTPRAVVEGILWGAAFLIKPLVALPALGCLALTLAVVLRRRLRRQPLAWDVGGVFCGGLLVGTAAVAWLCLSGNWPYFLEGNFGGWGQEYFRNSADWQQRAITAFLGLRPWGLVHLVALPAAVAAIDRTVVDTDSRGAGQVERVGQGLLAVFYLGWFAEANILLWQCDYHIVPPVILGLGLLAGEPWAASRRLVRWVVLPAFLLWIFFQVPPPLLTLERLALWGRCWQEGSSAELRDQLTLGPKPVAPSWEGLEKVAQFLEEREVRDREVTCYGASTLSLYRRLNLKPSTRFVMLWACLIIFKSHQDEILREVEASPQKYIVTDVSHPDPYRQHVSAPLPPDHLPKRFPWKYPVVFSSNRYLVHRVSQEEPETDRTRPVRK